jgi:transcriptional regulator with XRE-family HTH domain
MDNREASQIFGHRVRRKRQICGLTQKALADKLGVPATHISKLEGGLYVGIDFAEIHDLIEALMTSADYLLGISSDPGEIPEVLLEASSIWRGPGSDVHRSKQASLPVCSNAF